MRFISLLLIFFSIQLNAQESRSGGGATGVLLEPFLGMEFGTLSNAGNFDGSYNNFRFGSIIGYSVVGVQFGLDAGFSSGNHTQTYESKTYQASVLDWGLHLGYDISGFPMRVYGSYLMASELYLMPADTKIDYNGTGYKLGLSFTLFGRPYINFEYKRVDLEKKSQEGTVTPLREGEISSFIFTVSFPFIL